MAINIFDSKLRKFESFKEMKEAEDTIQSTKSHEEIKSEMVNFVKLLRVNVERNIEKIESDAPLSKTV